MECKLCGMMLVLAVAAMAACLHAVLDRPAQEIARQWPHATGVLVPALPQIAQTPDVGAGPAL